METSRVRPVTAGEEEANSSEEDSVRATTMPATDDWVGAPSLGLLAGQVRVGRWLPGTQVSCLRHSGLWALLRWGPLVTPGRSCGRRTGPWPGVTF
ncbi:hypothetical protein NDU88_002972 [Pleurodeles waltl]|uniref:Uncharacterized protein n=1 Tax=Pleurodeles waltl TaxID=8319 RepID=A0AAV7RFI6_PLEWA|nr:hypothetical protein NDU88_002972 [Pleurodeles waltl]